MKRKIIWGISINNFYFHQGFEINKAIKEIYGLGVKAIEVSFDKIFGGHNLTAEGLELLKRFDFVSMHAPIQPYPDNEETKGILQQLKKIYDIIKPDFIVFHTHNFEDHSVLLDFDWRVCIENSRAGQGWDSKRLIRLLEKYPTLGFVFDTCHAGEFSREEIDWLFKELKGRISYIHLSASNKEERHQGLHTLDADYLAQFSKIINFGKPLIMELWYPGLDEIKKELKFLRGRFG